MSYDSSTEIGVHIYLSNLLNRAAEIGRKHNGLVMVQKNIQIESKHHYYSTEITYWIEILTMLAPPAKSRISSFISVIISDVKILIFNFNLDVLRRD